MLFGMPTLAEFDELSQNAALCRETGLSFVELNMNLPQYQIAALRRAGLSKCEGVSFTLHMDENMSPCDWNPLVADAYRQTALEAIRLAKDEGIPVITMHMSQGVHFKLPSGKLFLFDRFWDEYRARLLAFRDACAREIGASGVTVTVENTSWQGFSHLAEAVALLTEAPCFRLCYDIGHDDTDGGLARGYYERNRAKWTHMHLHDANGATCHLPLGSARIDAREALAFAESGAVERVVIEVKTAKGLGESVAYLRESGIWAERDNNDI